MPWVVRLPLGPVKFPPLCPFCLRSSEGEREDVLHDEETSTIALGPLFLTKYDVYEVQVPICTGCRRRRDRLKRIGWLALAGFCLSLFGLPLLDPGTLVTGVGTTLLASAHLSLVVAIALLAVVLWKRRSFRVGKIVGGQVHYSMASRTYAEDFALANHAGVEYRLYAGRVPFVD